MVEDSEVRHLTTAEVAQQLGVKPATVYAYVSRGILTKVEGSDRHGSLFLEDEVIRLARRRRDSGRGGTLDDITTAISAIEDNQLRYRGREVVDLVASQSVESVASLLWTGELGPQQLLDAPADVLAATGAAVASLGADVRSTDRMRVAVTVAGARDLLRFDLSTDAVLRTAATILAVEAACFGPAPATAETLGQRLWPGMTDRPARADLLDATLILLADHGFAVSTVAVRVAASARVHPYGTVGAGLGAVDSQYHGAASTLAYRFLRDAIDDPLGTLSERLRLGGRPPGFGHLIYRTRDPRAEVLLTMLRTVPEAGPALRALDTVTAHLGRSRTVFPNIDLALAVLMHAFAMRSDAGEAIFAIARTIGWIAHTLEEYTESPLRFRPTGTRTATAHI
ncbi:citrate/2-methylcitrate synthase [Nocardia sp. NPDC051570]|uniref:citrate/2-methylcitrate synthase n=1 Tax=Nocardia sp. NPDC051570 TaxID=3364324 RepID=UPI0037BC892F